MKRPYRINLAGKKFNSLTVIKESDVDQRKTSTGKRADRYWWCKCECGETARVRHNHLLGGKIKSCGCRQFQKGNFHPSWTGHGEFSGAFFSIIKHGAKIRKLKFEITKKDIWDLFLKQGRKCALTGLELKFSDYSGGKDGTASLDRIDSLKGYTIDNIQWTHKDLNIMKMHFKEEQFIRYCQLVTQHKSPQRLA